jgi:hypothetical protein
MSNLVIGFFIALGVGIFMSFVGGFVYDLAWNVGDYASVNINQCETLQKGWIDQCENVKKQYESGKNLIHFASGLIPFFAVLLFFARQD